MTDQATKLREMIYRRNKAINPIQREKGQARVICVTSGKGGVGKTNFTLNLAIALSKQNKKVIIFDADLGLANIDVVIGTISKYNLLNVIKGDKELEEIMITGPYDVKIIPGGSGLVDLVDLSSEKLNMLLAKFENISKMADIILIDTGAGLSKTVMSFVLAAEEIIVVCTPEPTAITDAYAMIKNIAKDNKDKKIKVLINRVENINEGKEAYEKIKNASEKFLSVSIDKLGFLSEDTSVSKSVKAQNPFLLQYPNSAVSKNVELIALKLIDDRSIDDGFHSSSQGFFTRVINLFR